MINNDLTFKESQVNVKLISVFIAHFIIFGKVWELGSMGSVLALLNTKLFPT